MLVNIIHKANARQIAVIEYVLSTTQPNDYVYDGDIDFNVFRPDLDFFWFSLGDGGGLATYRTLHPYVYNVYHLIKKYHPKVISTYHINPGNRYIQNHYQFSRQFHQLEFRRSL